MDNFSIKIDMGFTNPTMSFVTPKAGIYNLKIELSQETIDSKEPQYILEALVKNAAFEIKNKIFLEEIK